MTSKQCKKCGQIKPVSEFYKKSQGGYSDYCKPCSIERSKAWYQENKEQVKDRLNDYHKTKRKELQVVLGEIKGLLGCAICGETDDCCLDFHHIDEKNKDRDVSKWLICKSPTRLMEEMSKCVCVCASCHRKIHAGKIASPTECLSLEWITNEFSKRTDLSKTRWRYSNRRKDCKQGKMERKKSINVCCKQCNHTFETKNYEQKYCSDSCARLGSRKVNRPDRETLKHLMDTMSWCSIGRQYGVSDNTVRKWAKLDGLLA